MKRKAINFTGLSQVDWARLAAFLDGEGHIRCCTKIQTVKGNRYQQDYLEVRIVNTDPRLGVWLESRFGGTVVSTRAQSLKWKATFSWCVGAAQAADVLRGALPYFVMKQEQAEIALAFAATMKRRGVKGTPQSVRDERKNLQAKLRVLTTRGPQLTEVAG